MHKGLLDEIKKEEEEGLKKEINTQEYVNDKLKELLEVDANNQGKIFELFYDALHREGVETEVMHHAFWRSPLLEEKRKDGKTLSVFIFESTCNDEWEKYKKSRNPKKDEEVQNGN